MSNTEMEYHFNASEYVGTASDGTVVHVDETEFAESLADACRLGYGFNISEMDFTEGSEQRRIYDAEKARLLDPDEWVGVNPGVTAEDAAEDALILALCHEAGFAAPDAELLASFRSNHHPEDIADAAAGDVAALAALRHACGLPVVR